MTLRIPHLAPIVGLLLLAGCTAAGGPQADPMTPTSLDAWASKVKVVPVPQEIRLAPHDAGLSVNQAAALATLVGDWRDAEAREIVIRAPDTGPTARGANRVAWDARDRLLGLGVPAQRIRMIAYDGGPEAGVPVVVGYAQYVAETPTCGDWRNLTHSNDNRVYDNFGCAVQSNLAAQLANPEDLLGPRDSTPADAQQRDVMYDKYRKGLATGSARDEKASGTVSQVVN